MEHIKTYFGTYPNSNEVFETSDNCLFHKEVDAKNHTVTLKDKDITPHKRKDYAGKLNDTPGSEASKDDAKAKADATAKAKADAAAAKVDAKAKAAAPKAKPGATEPPKEGA